MASSRSRARKSPKVSRNRSRREAARISRALAQGEQLAQSLREAENRAADKATETLAGATSELAKAIVAAPAPIMASGIEQARVDLVAFKTASTLYVNGTRQGSYDSNFDWALGSVLRSLAKTGCVVLTETDLSHLQGE